MEEQKQKYKFTFAKKLNESFAFERTECLHSQWERTHEVFNVTSHFTALV